MARIARVVVPEVPHHITQRGNRVKMGSPSLFNYHTKNKLAEVFL